MGHWDLGDTSVQCREDGAGNIRVTNCRTDLLLIIFISEVSYTEEKSRKDQVVTASKPFKPLLT